MHEYSVAMSLLDMIEDQVRDHPDATVSRVQLRIGTRAGVEIDLLRTAWEAITPQTRSARARLDIETVPETWACPLCQAALASDDTPICPTCEFPGHLTSGDELLLQRIELSEG
jgi:hydrogenase nickel incorporation protein HypA/HybF